MDLQPFNDFIMKNSVFFGISVAVLSAFVNELVGSFINDIIFPIIDRDGNDDDESDLKQKLRHKTLTVNKITFKYGSFIYSLIRFSLLIIILLIVTFFIKRH
jgi:large-conductance mechanosensitive channel